MWTQEQRQMAQPLLGCRKPDGQLDWPRIRTEHATAYNSLVGSHGGGLKGDRALGQFMYRLDGRAYGKKAKRPYKPRQSAQQFDAPASAKSPAQPEIGLPLDFNYCPKCAHDLRPHIVGLKAVARIRQATNEA